MLTVRNIMKKKVRTVTPWMSVASVVRIMDEFRESGLPVIDNDRLVGIITSRDVRGTHHNRLVADAMTRSPVVINSKDSLWEAKEMLEQHQIERIIVLEREKVVGIINQTQIYAELGKHIDSMTGLHKAEYLYQKSIKLLQNNNEISLIFIDIDNFGEVDKKYGHVVGDQILKLVADLLRVHVPESACLCRYAGDEFAIVLPDIQSKARELANQLLMKISKLSTPHNLCISASAGVAGGRRSNKRSRGGENLTVTDLINMASLASTKAKRERHQVVVVENVQLIEVT